jgi:hypothetical protein
MIAHSQWKYCSVSQMPEAAAEYEIVYAEGETEL